MKDTYLIQLKKILKELQTSEEQHKNEYIFFVHEKIGDYYYHKQKYKKSKKHYMFAQKNKNSVLAVYKIAEFYKHKVSKAIIKTKNKNDKLNKLNTTAEERIRYFQEHVEKKSESISIPELLSLGNMYSMIERYIDYEKSIEYHNQFLYLEHNSNNPYIANIIIEFYEQLAQEKNNLKVLLMLGKWYSEPPNNTIEKNYATAVKFYTIAVEKHNSNDASRAIQEILSHLQHSFIQTSTQSNTEGIIGSFNSLMVTVPVVKYSKPTIPSTAGALNLAQPLSTATSSYYTDQESNESRKAMNEFKFHGEVYFRDEKSYSSHCYQYASSSHDNGSMRPVAIIYAKDDHDIKTAISYANEQNIAIAIRTGGHQYSGASSTCGRNILLDMSSYTGSNDSMAEWEWNENSSELTTSISHRLAEFNKKLKELNIFVPHGQCSHVGIGGHLHTGGYGQLGRAFGLFADHITKFRIITADGTIRIVPRNSDKIIDKDLFYAVLGGSPGNFGVVTHITLKMHSDRDHPFSRGFKKFCLYTKERLKELLDIKVQMVKDSTFIGDFDYCITVMSGKKPWSPNTLDADMLACDDNRLSLDNLIPYNIIVIYAQWSNVDNGEQDNLKQLKNLSTAMEWFKKIDDASNEPIHIRFFGKLLGYIEKVFGKSIDYHYITPISELTPQWIYPHVREFLLPYHKRTYLTKYSDQLETNGWAEWVSNRIDDILSYDQGHGCKLTAQIQHFGGNNSQFFKKGLDGKTSFSWRDSTIVCVLDCFYDPNNPTIEETAKSWQKRNDEEGVRNSCIFSDFERKVFWGSYGSIDLNSDEGKKHYYDSPEKYTRLLKIKQAMDPNNVFTPNAFCIGLEKPPTNLLFSNVAYNSITIKKVEWNDQQMLTNSIQNPERNVSIINQATMPGPSHDLTLVASSSNNSADANFQRQIRISC